MAVLVRAVCRVITIPIKISMILFEELEKKILKLMCKHRRFLVVKATLSRKINADVITDFRLQYRALMANTAWCCHKINM